MNNSYPEVIKNLPEAIVPFKGIRGWVSQGDNHQIVFFEIESIGEVPRHSHAEQWGIVIEGSMDLCIGDETKNYQKGDQYYIPEGVLHSAKFYSKTVIMDFFAEKDRYLLK